MRSSKLPELIGTIIGQAIKAGAVLFCAYKTTSNWYSAVLILFVIDALERKG